MPTTGGGQRRLLFTGNVKTNLVNKYTSGAGVGAINVSSRRALKRRATSSAGTLDADGNLIPGKPCCSLELARKPKATAHLMLGSSFSGLGPFVEDVCLDCSEITFIVGTAHMNPQQIQTLCISENPTKKSCCKKCYPIS